MVKTGAAAQARVAERPAEVLARMNRHLYSQLDGNLVTAIYAFVDINARRVSLANAGHPHPLLLSNGRRNAEEAGTRGAALGLLPGEQYVATELTLSPGDRLVLYSDGLVEAKSPAGALFERNRLRTALLDHAALAGGCLGRSTAGAIDPLGRQDGPHARRRPHARRAGHPGPQRRHSLITAAA